MYYFKTDLKEQFLDGRTIKYYADKIGITNGHLTNILNGKKHCSKAYAYSIVKVVDINNEVEDYFETRGE